MVAAAIDCEGISTVTDLPPIGDNDLFDEAGYLRRNPGIVAAMIAGTVDTAWGHYLTHGRGEGRASNDVDPVFYLAAYPGIEQDLGRPADLADAAPHYVTLGRARGYLPNATAPRPANGAAFPSPFGGLWIDQANALDLIQGRLDLGRIRRNEAARLRRFALDGIVALDHPFDKDLVQAAGLAISQAFTGMFPDLLFGRAGPAGTAEPWRPELTEQHVAALDPHMMSGEIRDLLFDKAILDFLSLIFDAPPRLTASRAFLRQAAPPDRDVSWFAHTLPLQFVAITFALEDAESGMEIVWPGSHRLPDLPWDTAHLTMSEVRRTGTHDLDGAMARRGDRVHALLRGRDSMAFEAKPGTAMARHANLIYTVQSPEPPRQQRGLTARYCSSHVQPNYVEASPTRTHARDGFVYSSGIYPTLDPLD
ncbi:MAG: hypothetical protein EXR07_19840 [Acetobacteraceae bacterium]|nr:hypothetical protein [Acetobacteraceae bacterium]